MAHFSANRLEAKNIVEVRWTLKANVSCQSPQVQRSTNGELFSTIYTFPGVCGGSPSEESYSWIDQSALDSYTYFYRLRIDDAEYSSIELVEAKLPLGELGVFLYPNPSSSAVYIRYEASFGRIESIRWFNMEGREVYLIQSDELQFMERGLEKFVPSNIGPALYFIECRFSSGVFKQLKLIYRPEGP